MTATTESTARPLRHRPLAAFSEQFLRPIAQAHGAPRTLLITGGAIVAFFLAIAIFAPVIAPFAFDQYQSDGSRGVPR